MRLIRRTSRIPYMSSRGHKRRFSNLTLYSILPLDILAVGDYVLFSFFDMVNRKN